MSELTVSPKSVSIQSGQTQTFQALLDGSPTPVDWSVVGQGKIDKDGVYSPPVILISTAKDVVIARSSGGRLPATAEVELVPLIYWRRFIGRYLLIVFTLLIIAVFWFWESLCTTCTPDRVLVSPPVVTLTKGQAQQFIANADVDWGRHGAPGVYEVPATVPATGQRIIVTARTQDSPPRSGSAHVILSHTLGLAVQPATATISAGGSVDLMSVITGSLPAGAAVEWMIPALGTLTPLGTDHKAARFSVAAPAAGSAEHPVSVMVLARIDGQPNVSAGAWITVLPSGARSAWCCADGSAPRVGRLLMLVALLGALGGMIHGISSFTTFIGNRQFVTSWAWWYLFKPFLSALVAVVVFLVFRAGLGTGAFTIATSDCVTVAAVAGLIGLFAEAATMKLKDIFDALFTPRQDQRKDTLAKDKNNQKDTPPKLDRLEPATVAAGTDLKELTILGSGFSDGCQVKIGSAELRVPTSKSATSLKVALQPTDIAKADKVTVVVYNSPPNGGASNSVDLIVEAQ